jgi:putative aldouronate transport system permease protein
MNTSVTKVKKRTGKRTWGQELLKNKYLYLIAVPVVVYYIIFCYLPMFGAVIAFKNYEMGKGIIASSWVGLKHFKDFFGGVYFKRTFFNTIKISCYEIIFGFPAPIIFAFLMNELRNEAFKKTVQTITYLPHFISMVVICGMIVDFFSSNGIVTEILSFFGGEKINYVGDPRYFRAVYVATGIWQGIGWGSIIYLAAFTGIDQELYEAAAIDGAGRFRRMLHISLPGIAPTITIMLIMRIGTIMSVGYEKIILLYGPTTYEVADVISSYAYRMGISGARYSFSTAVGLFQSVINFALLLFANGFSKKLTDSGLF